MILSFETTRNEFLYGDLCKPEKTDIEILKEFEPFQTFTEIIESIIVNFIASKWLRRENQVFTL